jgi:signal transduction histidine kinase
MKRQQDSNDLFAFAHRYAAVSLVAILITATALAFLYRELSIRFIVGFGEQANVTVAGIVLNAMLPELVGYVQAKEPVDAVATLATVPIGLLSLIRGSVRDTRIERIKVFSRNGLVLYSTAEHEIGTSESANPRFQKAIRGTVRSQLLFHDAFSLFGAAGGEENLIETYVPIRQAGNPDPIGVLEIYTDVDLIVRATSHHALVILIGILVIMLILYSFLLYVVEGAERIITSQRQTILDRNHTLEVLSERMLHAEEAERRRVAWELHEEIAQTLSAVKVKVDALANAAMQPRSHAATADLGEEILPLVQAAIEEVRVLAVDLRPPTLDEFGLVATTWSLCREAELVHGQVAFTADKAVREDELPDLLKSIIFRITQQTLKRLVRTPGVSDIRVALKREEGLQLVVDFRAETDETGTGDRPAPLPQAEDRPIADFWERAVLAGGSFRIAHSDSGRFCYQATWIV